MTADAVKPQTTAPPPHRVTPGAAAAAYTEDWIMNAEYLKLVIAAKILSGEALTFGELGDILNLKLDKRGIFQMAFNLWRYEQKQQLANLLSFVELQTPFEYSNPAARENVIRGLISLLVDKIRLEIALGVIKQKKLGDAYLHPGKQFIIEPKRDATSLYLQIGRCRIEPTPEMTIDLATYPVIPAMWNKQRMRDAIANIGTVFNPWKQQFNNHQVSVWEPMGVAISISGNHSIFAGVQKRTGVIHIGADSIYEANPHEVYDLSPLYKYIFFDGVYYRWRSTPSEAAAADPHKGIAGIAASFEFGCIFELGRLLLSPPENETAVQA
jgi:hypothetical protein